MIYLRYQKLNSCYSLIIESSSKIEEKLTETTEKSKTGSSLASVLNVPLSQNLIIKLMILIIIILIMVVKYLENMIEVKPKAQIN